MIVQFAVQQEIAVVACHGPVKCCAAAQHIACLPDLRSCSIEECEQRIFPHTAGKKNFPFAYPKASRGDAPIERSFPAGIEVDVSAHIRIKAVK